MMAEAATLLAAALAAIVAPWSFAWPLPWSITPAAPNYLAAERAVGNWRLEASLALDLDPLEAVRLAAGDDPARTPRCVRLNNYWCVKRGGWVGEIAADSEGHVAFASADDGAAVAALLLRRYYVDYKRRSAQAIVSRWAPARCSPPTLAVRPTLPEPPPRPGPARESRAPEATTLAVARTRAEPPSPRPNRMMPQRVVAMGLAPFGLENTLRARWLAAHGRGGVAATPKASRATARPAVAAATTGEGANSATVPPGAKPPDLPRPVDSCVGEQARVANYAARVVFGVVAGADDDLALFSADGAPTDNLAKVMANMAAVEIGPLRASDAIIASGIARMTRALSAGKSAASTKSAPPADEAAAVAHP